MSLSNKKKTQSTSDIFNDDFEVIYEGDLPDISIDDDDDYRDVLSGLSDIDHTDYIKKNDYDRLTSRKKDPIQIHQSSVKNGNTSADCLDHLSFGTAFSGQCRFVWQYCFPLNISGSGTDRISRGWCGIITL